MGQAIDVEVRGIITNPNALSKSPKGALSIANNGVIDKPGVYESRRGQNAYGLTVKAGLAGNIEKLFSFKDSLIVAYEDQLAYDSDNNATWIPYSGTFEPITGEKIRATQANSNFYFTTNEGIKKLSNISDTPISAGAVKALGGVASLSGSSGFMATATQIAYRIVWGYEDGNKNLILGTPSQRILISNASGGSRDISLTFDIPDGVATNWFYQLYRSKESASATSEPDDELQLVYEDNPTSAQITAKSVTVVDTRPNELRGAALYTNPSQQGILQSNDEPPMSKDLCTFRNTTFYANTTSKHRLFLNVISVGAGSINYESETGDTTNGSAIITSIGDTSVLRVGMRAVGTGIPADAVIDSIDSATQVTLTENATVTNTTVAIEFQDRLTIGGVDYWAGSSNSVVANQFEIDTSATPGEDIETTSKNLISIINTSADNTTIYAYYVSGFNDLPGQILFEERGIGGAAFSATSTAGLSFDPILGLSGTAIASDNEQRKNRVAFSKQGIPEAVPVGNTFDIGSADKEIKRIIPLREAVFVLKEDGVWRITGFTGSDFTVYELDLTAIIKASETFVALNNKIYGVGDQGVISISDSGIEIISLEIEDTIQQISDLDSFNAVAFGVGYETDRKFMLFCPSEDEDTYCDQGYIYNYYTNAWTRWVMDRNCGVISRRDNKLYMGNPINKTVYKERKNFDNTDYSDESFGVTIVNVDGLDIEVNDATDVEVGFSLKQGNSAAIIRAIDGNVLTVGLELNWNEAAAEIHKPINVELKTIAYDAENPGLKKHWTKADFFFRSALFESVKVGFESNFSQALETYDIASIGIGAIGTIPIGTFPIGGTFGGENTIPTLTPIASARSHWLKIYLQLNEAFRNFEFQGVSIEVKGVSLGGYKS